MQRLAPRRISIVLGPISGLGAEPDIDPGAFYDLNEARCIVDRFLTGAGLPLADAAAAPQRRSVEAERGDGEDADGP
jgi:hypothetical protein